MTTEDTINDARKTYAEHPQLAFSMLLDVVEAQDKCLRHSIAWAQQIHGDHGVKQLLDMLDLSANAQEQAAP